MNHLLLAVHITLALGLTILLGVQCAELGRLRREARSFRRAPAAAAAVAAIFPVTIGVAATGGMLLQSDDARGGPWVAAGVVSSLVVVATAVWTLRLLRQSGAPSTPSGRSVSSVQWGAPAFVLVAAFLMAERPEAVLPAVLPMILAVVVMVAAYVRGGRAVLA